MASLNKVLLIGNLTRDPELRYTQGGTAICNFSLAINSFYNDKQGQKQKDTCFMRVTVWGKSGESCAQHLTKGRPVFVEGRLRSRSWETEDGQKRSSIEVVADRVEFLGAPGGQRPQGAEGDEAGPAPAPSPDPVAGDEGDIPF